jgi:hypothetical protein
LTLGAPARAEQPVAFTVLRDGAPIGTHRVTFSRQGADTIAQVEIDLRVRFAGFSVYRYTHSSRETWRGGRLIALDARTDDNGARTTVTAQATPEGLIVNGPTGRITAPAEILPTSYWRRDTVQRAQLLDTQRGRVVDVSAGPPIRETKTLGERSLPVRYWNLTGDLDLAIAYSDQGVWSSMRFRLRGSDFVYLPSDGHVLLAQR